MKLITLAFYACLCHFVLAFSGFTKTNGRTKLLGSSFGVLGVNRSFDYVVSNKNLSILKDSM